MQLINKQNDVAFLLRQVAEHAFQTLFEFTTVFSPCHQRAHIQCQHTAAFQPFRHFTIDNALRQPFDDGGFTYAGLTNQHGVVFSTTLQYLDGTANLFITPNHRIELAFLGALGEIYRIFL